LPVPVQGITVDVMPTGENILGFSNRWYPEGYRNAMVMNIGDNYCIRLLQPAWFIASKLEAFRGRGGNDGRMSTDFEDIVFVLNNRTSIWEEMKNAPTLLNEYIQQQFRSLLIKEYIYEWVSVHLDYSEQKRVN
jgi:hypothetical protein